MSEQAPSVNLDGRLLRLEAEGELRRLKQLYSAAADAKYNVDRTRKPKADLTAAAELQASYFSEDAVWEGGPFGGPLAGRMALAEFFARSPWHFTIHSYLNPLFEIGEGMARASWQLWQVGIRKNDGATVLLLGQTRERYVRHPVEGWRISKMVFERLHEVVLAQEPDALRCVLPLGERT